MESNLVWSTEGCNLAVANLELNEIQSGLVCNGLRSSLGQSSAKRRPIWRNLQWIPLWHRRV
eukprot:11181205-Lingulodinium_polyedra.AAC.1